MIILSAFRGNVFLVVVPGMFRNLVGYPVLPYMSYPNSFVGYPRDGIGVDSRQKIAGMTGGGKRNGLNSDRSGYPSWAKTEEGYLDLSKFSKNIYILQIYHKVLVWILRSFYGMIYLN